MNKLFLTILAATFAFFNANATDVDLKITYKGSGVSGHTVTISVGGADLGSGVTDGGGNVTISVSSLPSKRIDLRGEKECNNARKSWSADGYVTLDGGNNGDLKLDELTKMMADASGGFITEEGLAKSYGLVCSLGGDKEEEQNPIVSDSSRAGRTLSTANNFADMYKQREEQLASKKEFYTTKLQTLDGKIERKNKKMDGYDEKEKQEALYEIREWQIEKKMTQNDLDKVNTQMSHKKQILDKEERNEFDDREDLLKEEMDELKADKKAGKLISEDMVKAEIVAAEKKNEEKKETVKVDIKENDKNEDESEKEKEVKVEVKEKSKKELEKEKEELAKEEEKAKLAAMEKHKEAEKEAEKERLRKEEEAEKERLKKEEEEKKLAEEEKEKAEKEAREDLIYTQEEFANMSRGDLGKEKFGLKSDLSKLELKISTRKKSMTPNELTEAEARVAKIEAAIKSIEEEQARRGNEEETENVDSTGKTTQTVSDTLIASSDTTVSNENDLVYTEAEFANMSKNDLGKKKLGLNSELSKLELKLSTRKKSMTPNELAEAEARKIKLEKAIKAIEAEQERRKIEKEKE